MSKKQSERIAWYLEMLQEAPLPAVVLHERLQRVSGQMVSLRTVQEDLRGISGDDMPLVENVSRSQLGSDVPAALMQYRVFYRLISAEDLIPLSRPITCVSELEVLALRLARDLLAAPDEAMRSPLADACAHLLERFDLEEDALADCMGVSLSGQQAYQSEHLLTILRAIRVGDGIKMVYRGTSMQEKKYKVHPVRLMFSQADVYVWVWDPTVRTIKNFKLDRIISIDACAALRNVPSGVHAEVRVATRHSFHGMYAPHDRGEVVIRFDQSAVPFIQGRTYGTSQEWKNLSDGAVRLSFKASICSVSHWTMQFGSRAYVESPPQLRAYVEEQARATVALYGDSL